jgi:hypothetical protein
MPHSGIKARRYCLLPEEATAATTHEFHCGVGGHPHLNFVELYGAVDYASASQSVQLLGKKYIGCGGLLERGEVEWLCFPRVLRLRREPEKRKQGRVQLNDLSARVGPFLAEAVRRTKEHEWPHVLLAAIRPATAGRR